MTAGHASAAAAPGARPGRWLEYASERPGPHGMEHVLADLRWLLREAHATRRLALLPALDLERKHNFGVRHDWQWEWYFDLAASRLIDAAGTAHPLPIATHRPPPGARTLIVGPGEAIPPLARDYPRVVRRYATPSVHPVQRGFSWKQLRCEFVHSGPVRDLAREAVGEIAANAGRRFAALHVRRGDRLSEYPAYLTEPEGIRDRLRELVPDGSVLFVMSDERDPNFWAPLRRHYRLVRYTDMPRLAALVSRAGGRAPDNYLLYAVEKEIAARAWMRIATFAGSWVGWRRADHALVDKEQRMRGPWQAATGARRVRPFHWIRGIGRFLRRRATRSWQRVRPAPVRRGPPAPASGATARAAGRPATGDAPWPPPRRAPGIPVQARRPRCPAPTVPHRAEYGLGVEVVALGARAQAVFGQSSRVARTAAGRRADVALADTAAEAAGLETPVVVLAEAPPRVSVPAFDPLADNPIGWQRRGQRTVVALGPLDRLPQDCRANHAVRRDSRHGFRRIQPVHQVLLRSVHHLEDVQAFHGDAVSRAGELVRLAASGAVVHLADGDRRLAAYLGAELFELMTREVRDLDTGGREALSIRMRRAALREHSLASRARQVAERALSDPPRPPLVSILLLARRPGHFDRVLSAVRRQNYPRLELILGLHGEGCGEAPRAAAGPSAPLTVLRLDGSMPPGPALNAAAEASRGTLLTTMDDGHLYGPDHVWDLVLAQEYSHAPLVGKGAEFVYLAAADRTIRRPTGGAEQFETIGSPIDGAALLVTRPALDRIGGWKGSGEHVAQVLIDNVVRAGERVYRTHPHGFVLVRRGRGNTDDVDDACFRAQAEVDEPGWRPELAGVGDASPAPAGPIGQDQLRH